MKFSNIDLKKDQDYRSNGRKRYNYQYSFIVDFISSAISSYHQSDYETNYYAFIEDINFSQIERMFPCIKIEDDYVFYFYGNGNQQYIALNLKIVNSLGKLEKYDMKKNDVVYLDPRHVTSALTESYISKKYKDQILISDVRFSN